MRCSVSKSLRQVLLGLTVAVTLCTTSWARTTFAVIGDYGGGGDVAELVSLASPDFIVTAGDNNYSNAAAGHLDWDRQVGTHYGEYIPGRVDDYYELQTGENLRFFPSVGNHDVTDGSDGFSDRSGYLDYFHANPGGTPRLPAGHHAQESSYYDVRMGDVHLFALDSQAIVEGVGGTDQLEWLDGVVENSDATWKFAFFHHSPFSSSSHGSHEAMQMPFADWGIDAVFSAHDHVYERFELATNFFVVGTGGRNLYPFRSEIVAGSKARFNDNSGALFVSLDGDVADFFFLDITGEQVDRLTINKSVPEPQYGMWLMLLLLAIRRTCR